MEILTTAVIDPEPGDIGRRVDAVLAGALENVSRNTAQQWIIQGLCTVNGQTVQKNYRLRPGDRVTCLIPQPVPYTVAAEDIPLAVVFEDEHVLVVDKPRGMVVHPAAGHTGGTLVNALLHHCQGALSGINGEIRPGIVHRIDKDTSGLLVVAKNDQAHRHLSEQLAAHAMRRVYHGVVRHNIKEDHMDIDLPLGRHPLDRKRMTVVKPGEGRHAVTHVTVLERMGLYTLIEARLETGRTHQIRVHMAHKGFPLLGDRVYGGDRQPFHLDGQILHARSLGFVHPHTGRELFFDSAWPPYFAEVMEKIKPPKGQSTQPIPSS